MSKSKKSAAKWQAYAKKIVKRLADTSTPASLLLLLPGETAVPGAGAPGPCR